MSTMIKECRIQWHDTKEELDVKIAIGKFDKKNDDEIFFYCNKMSEFWGLTKENNGEDFTIIKVYSSKQPQDKLMESQSAFNLMCDAMARYISIVANQVGTDIVAMADEDCDTGEDEVKRVMWDYTTKHGEVITGAFSKAKCDQYCRIFYFYDEWAKDWIPDYMISDKTALLQYITYQIVSE